jgi:hypothetical protein
MAILKSAVVLGNANINGEARILKNLTLDSGITSTTNASDTKFWNTNGGTKTAAEIVGGGLTMKDNNIQLTGSQLGLNSTLTGMAGVWGSSTATGNGIKLSGTDATIYGSKIMADSQTIYLGEGASSGGAPTRGLGVTATGITLRGAMGANLTVSDSYCSIGVSGGNFQLGTNYGMFGTATSGYMYLYGGNCWVNLGIGSFQIYTYNTGTPINIGASWYPDNPTYLWGSVFVRNNMTIATSGSTVGCTMKYDETEECVKFTF